MRPSSLRQWLLLCAAGTVFCTPATGGRQSPDAGALDAGFTDAGPPDAGQVDAGHPDAGALDAGQDAGTGACRLDSTVHAGDMTEYDDAASSIECFRNLPSGNRVALNTADYQSAARCGACIQIQQALPDGGAGPAVNAVVDDECPTCNASSIDVSPATWLAVTGNSGDARDSVTWSFVACDVDGGVSLDFDSSNPYYTQVQLSNTRNPVASLTLQDASGNGPQTMSRSTSNSFSYTGSGLLVSPVQLKATDSLGQVITLPGPPSGYGVETSSAQFPETCVTH